MKRLTVTLENYDDSKVVCSSLVSREEESIISGVLGRSGVQFAIEEVQLPLFNYRLDYGRSYIDLQLRTKAEIGQWIENESFENTAASFLRSESHSLRLELDREGAFVEINRQEK